MTWVAEVLLNESSVSLEWVYKKSKSEFQSVKDYSGICCEDPAYIFSEKQIDIEKLISSFPVDVIVDFSNSSAIFTYADSVKSRNISLISAISSYPDKCLVVLKEISKRTRVIYSPNITLGINFLLLMSKMLKSIAPDADIEIIEEHFSLKKEVSGTAKVLAR